MKPLLDVQNITVRFGGVTAVDDVSFQMADGEFLCLIGPNGAGKTTLLRSILGTVNAESGRVFLADRDISASPTHLRVRKGLGMTHQIVRPFRSMTILDNVAFAAGHRRFRNVVRASFSFGRSNERRLARTLLESLGIGDQSDKPVTGQPMGILKRLEVARALALSPKILLLDEPLAGLNNTEAEALADVILRINRDGMPIAMIEHNLGEVLRVAQRLVVLDNGRKIADGNPEDVMRLDTVRSAYIGSAGKKGKHGNYAAD